MFSGSGIIKLNNNLSVGSVTYLANQLSVNSDIFIQKNLIINNTLSVSKGCYIGGNIIIDGHMIIGDDYLGETSNINGIIGNYIDNKVVINNTLSVSGTTFMNNSLSVGSNTFISGSINITGNYYLNNTLFTGGNSSNANTISLNDGTVSTPSLNFESNNDTGIYRGSNVLTNYVIGNEIIGYNNRDGYNGATYIHDVPFGSAYIGGTVKKVLYWSESTASITFILFEKVSGSYIIRAVADSLTNIVGNTGWRDFTISSGFGSAVINSANYYLGWKDGTKLSFNSGVMTYTGSNSTRYACKATYPQYTYSTGDIGNPLPFDNNTLGNRKYEYQLQIEMNSSSSLAFSIDGVNAGSLHNVSGNRLVDFPGLVNSNGIFSPSDMRIKKDIEDIPDNIALAVVNELKPKSYNYIYSQDKQNDNIVGFISQDVYDVVPEAVYRGTNYIPNILNSFNIIDKIIQYPNHGLKDTTRIAFKKPNSNNILYSELEIIDKDQFILKEHSDLIDNSIFIIGTVVDDFMYLDKQYLITFAVGALQQISSDVDTLKAKMDILESK